MFLAYIKIVASWIIGTSIGVYSLHGLNPLLPFLTVLCFPENMEAIFLPHHFVICASEADKGFGIFEAKYL